jgi:thiamine kinase-like enzyme
LSRLEARVLETVLAGLEGELGPRHGEPVSLDGGITNRNLRVQFGEHDAVVRLPGKETELLGIDREAERVATAAAASVGVGPEVLAFLAGDGCLVTRFIAGRGLEPADVREVLGEVADALRAVHGGPALPSAFDAWDVVDTYRATAQARGGRIPDVFAGLRETAERVRAALTDPEHAPVPCHNDLLPANFIHDGERVRILDWEYAGMGDRYFDLGNLSVNNGFDEVEDERLLEVYWREPCTPRRFAALRLMRIMSDFREGMWGVVQTAISELDFDFVAYADEHLGRVGAAFADPRVEGWLEDARG